MTLAQPLQRLCERHNGCAGVDAAFAASPAVAPSGGGHAGGMDVVTLTEGHYSAGLGALLNSLVRVGFAGTVHVGHRGPQPDWLRDRDLAPGVALRAVPVRTDRHLTHHKPRFLREVLAASDADALLWLDTDVVVRQGWPFFVDWVRAGVAVCADADPWFPSTHPTRRAWLALARELGDELCGPDGAPPPVDLYVNAGLVGVTRDRAAFLDTWERYLAAMGERGPGLVVGPGTPGYSCAGRSTPFLLPDQDALNLAVMAHPAEVSMMGPQAMGLGPGWSVVSHAVGGPKPWRRASLLPDALRGRAPGTADVDFVRHARGPVPVLSRRRARLRRADLRLARLVAALLR